MHVSRIWTGQGELSCAHFKFSTALTWYSCQGTSAEVCRLSQKCLVMHVLHLQCRVLEAAQLPKSGQPSQTQRQLFSCCLLSPTRPTRGA